MIDPAMILVSALGLLWQLPPIIFAVAVLVALFAVIREHRGALGRREPESRDRN
ncbi:MAG: hypothetical protein F2813_08035 [Actinobacteria bacterium]|nr:hypothetical protein [Actinomycetota bacterium]